MGIIITKLQNDNVEITGVNQPYTLLGSMGVYRQKSSASFKDGVSVVQNEVVKDFFTSDNVDQVVRKDGTVTAISDADTLYSELKEYFFFELEGSGGGGGGIGEAPNDGKQYGRQSLGWTEITGGGGGTPVKSSHPFNINAPADWVADGSEFVYDIVHNLGTRDLLINSWDNSTNELYEPLNIINTDDNTTRIVSVSNAVSLYGLVSKGGESKVIDSYNQQLVSSNKTITTSDEGNSLNVFGVGSLCDLTINTGSLNEGGALEVNVGDSDGFQFVAGAGVNLVGTITGSTIEGDTVGLRRLPDDSFGLTGEVYKVI